MTVGHRGRDDGGWLTGYKSDGSVTLTPGADGSVTLANSTTYYFPVGKDYAALPSMLEMVAVHLKWASEVAATITIEASDFPAKVGGLRGGGGYDVVDYDTTAGNWIQLNPSTAYVPTAGTGNSATAAVVTAGGTNAGGCIFQLTAIPDRRVRIKLVVTTGGALWINAHGKAAA